MPTEQRLTPREIVTLALFTILVGLLFADQNLMAPNLTAIAKEFGMDDATRDAKLGASVNLVFWMLGGTVTLLIGYLADRSDITKKISRKWMLVGVTLFGQAACLASGLARNYEEMYWARAMTGVGIGGCFPLIYSLLGDYFPPKRRATATATVGLAMGIGIALGQLLAGMLAASHGWRLPFFLVSIPGMVFTLIFAMIAREPARGQHEAALKEMIARGEVYEERIRLKDLPDIFRVRTNQLLFMQCVFGTVPWGIFFVYLNDYYAQDKGFSVAEATLLVMVIGAAAIIGAFIGGLLGQYFYNKAPRYLPMLCAVTTTVGVLPMAVLISYPATPGTSLLGPMIVGATTGVLIAVTGPNVNTILINVNAPERRGAAFSLFNLFNDLGRGLGAWVVGLMAVSLGRVTAFHVANLMWLFCGGLLFVIVRCFPRDEAALQARLAAAAKS